MTQHAERATPRDRAYTLGSLFTGIGGIDLAFEREGFEIAFQVEIDDYCNKVLAKHWPNVKRYGDIRTVTDLPAVDVLAGGFPCQDISQAGKSEGIKEGNRYDLGSSSWKTYQLLLAGDWALFSDIFPRWGTMRNGELWRLPSLVHLTGGSVGGAWPTPDYWDGKRGWGIGAAERRLKKYSTIDLLGAINMWPTPVQTDSDNRTVGKGSLRLTSNGTIRRQNADRTTSNLGLVRTVQYWASAWPTPKSRDYKASSMNRHTPDLPAIVEWATPQSRDYKGRSNQPSSIPAQLKINRTLNPSWVEQLMGFPDGWTSLEGLPGPDKSSIPTKHRAPSPVDYLTDRRVLKHSATQCTCRSCKHLRQRFGLNWKAQIGFKP